MGGYIVIMSLLIVGSCSRVTQNIVLALSKQQLYHSITIADLLPTYHFHQRYYALRKQLSLASANTAVKLSKIAVLEELNAQVHSHTDVLCVTHDYFQTVTSKTKLIELTAQLASKKNNFVLAAPADYDHFAFANADQHALNTLKKVQKAHPNTTIIRSDLQEGSEVFAYLNQTKGFLEERLLSIPDTFRPSVISSSLFTNQVVTALRNKSKGETIALRGDTQKTLSEITHDKDVQPEETAHHAQNIRNLVKSYAGVAQAAQAI